MLRRRHCRLGLTVSNRQQAEAAVAVAVAVAVALVVVRLSLEAEVELELCTVVLTALYYSRAYADFRIYLRHII